MDAHISQRWRMSLAIESTKYGLGVFAIQKFKKKELVGIVTGEILDDPDHSSDYCIDLGGDFSLEPDAPFRFLNHSCEPNCQIVMEEFSKPKKNHPPKFELRIETIRKIRPGDQLSIDYGWPAEDAIPCGCRAKTCRGFIVAEDEQHLIEEFFEVG